MRRIARPAGRISGPHQRVRGALLTVALAPLLAVTGCAEDGGVRLEGTAPASVSSPPPRPSPGPAVKVDSVALLTNDPNVSSQIKSELTPCGGHEYPIDTSYGDVTGDSTPDVVINVETCTDGVGIASYVYREENGQYVDVFASDQPPVYVEIDKGDLELTRQVYAASDHVCCPSGEDVITYHWDGSRFTETSRVHNDYGTSQTG